MKEPFSQKLSVFLALILLFALGSEAQGKRHRSHSASRARTINASGCVAAGVEAGCLVLTDSKTKTLYNLFFGRGKKPQIGTAIRFTGTEHDGPTTCMQGKAVDVTKWAPVKMKCPSEQTQ